MITEEEFSGVIMKESLRPHRDTPTATAVNWHYMAHEKSHYKSSKLVSEGVLYLSSSCLVMFGFIASSFQTFLQNFFQVSKFSLDIS